MLTTEEQAKTRVCPHLPVDREADGLPAERIVRESVISFARCLGTGCMSWRWLDGRGAADRRGYCGLAGHPGMQA